MLTKPKILLGMMLIFSGVLTSSCNKCLTCEETTVKGQKGTPWRTICGSKDEIEKYQEFIESSKDPGSTLECKIHEY